MNRLIGAGGRPAGRSSCRKREELRNRFYFDRACLMINDAADCLSDRPMASVSQQDPIQRSLKKLFSIIIAGYAMPVVQVKYPNR